MSIMGLDRVFLSEYYGEGRKAILSEDKYHYIVDMYEGNELVYTKLVTKDSPDCKMSKTAEEAKAEDIAEDWVL